MVNMEPFIRKYQPDRIDAWLKNQDFACHPEDPPHIKKACQVRFNLSFSLFSPLLGKALAQYRRSSHLAHSFFYDKGRHNLFYVELFN